MICFHGTTQQGLKNILLGENEKHVSPWVVSDNDGAMYLYPLDKLVSSHEIDCSEEAFQMGVITSLESAIIQTCMNNETVIYSLVLNIPDELLVDDYSCENMADIASYIECNEFDPSMIIGVYKETLSIWDKPSILSNVRGLAYFNTSEVDEHLLNLAESLADADIYNELDLVGEHVPFNDIEELIQGLI